ncbi:hypothetical protein [Spirochaeta dissipatitropha]
MILTPGRKQTRHKCGGAIAVFLLASALFITGLILPPTAAAGEDDIPVAGQIVPGGLFSDSDAHMLYFKSNSCFNCVRQQKFLDALMEQYPDLRIVTVDIDHQSGVWAQFRRENGINSGSIPRTLAAGNSFIGFLADDGPLEYLEPFQAYFGYENQLRAAAELAMGLHDAAAASAEFSAEDEQGMATRPPPLTAGWWYWAAAGAVFAFYVLVFFIVRLKKPATAVPGLWLGGFVLLLFCFVLLTILLTPETVIRNFADLFPFPVFVMLIALADGFNPCAFAVLAILLSLLTHTKSRRDMILIGGIFILFSGIVYFGFIMIMVSLGSFAVGRIGSLLFLVLGLIVIAAGLVHIKDFFFFKSGPSLSISPERQKTIHKKARKIMDQLKESRTESAGRNPLKLMAAVGGTIMLALFVNLVELGCTAVLPTVYMAALLNICSGFACYALWTGLYALVYILPLAVILTGFLLTFRSTRINELQGRWLKLIAGLFLIFFGFILLSQFAF